MPGIEYEKLKNSPELRVVVKENDISHSIAKADFPNARLVFVPQLSDPQELLQFVTDGKGDMTFAEINLMEIFTKTKQKKLVQATSDPIRIYENTFVFKKDDLSLKNLIDDEIGVMLASGKLSELIEKYI